MGTARKILLGAYLVFALALIGFAASTGWDAALAILGGFAIFGVGWWLALTGTRARRRRRQHAIAQQRPGWHLHEGLSTATQTAQLRAQGSRLVVGTSVTLGYGPGGIEVWSGFRRPRAILSLPWSAVLDVKASQVRTARGAPAAGLSLLLADGTRQDVLMVRRREGSVLPITPALLDALVDDIGSLRPHQERADRLEA